MGIRVYRPTSAGRRNASVSDFAELTPGAVPEKSLLKRLKRHGGRNNQGKITARHRGGGHKKMYRVIDFHRTKDGVPAKVDSVQYDPHRSARIALLHYADGEKRYVIAVDGLKAGRRDRKRRWCSSEDWQLDADEGDSAGTEICCIEMQPGRGAMLCRSAGTSAVLMAREGDWAQLQLPSGEIRRVPNKCRATIGKVSNPDHDAIIIGKAGRNRWKGKRPHVRGTAMNPIDHPHGGGEGRTKGGSPSSESNRQASQGWRNSSSSQAIECVDYPTSSIGTLWPIETEVIFGGAEGINGTFDEKGSFCGSKVVREAGQEPGERIQSADYDLGTSLHDCSRVCRSDLHGPQWQSAHQGVRDGRHGWAQAW